MPEKVYLRDRASVARFPDGLDLVEPGVIRAAEWRPDSELEAGSPAAMWGGVARKR
jgi:S-adenosyl methyltransferase